ncbi:hypothetical protein [Microlunatus elymi]|nr:hypothetical protein [Microlunatus elymi]
MVTYMIQVRRVRGTATSRYGRTVRNDAAVTDAALGMASAAA